MTRIRWIENHSTAKTHGLKSALVALGYTFSDAVGDGIHVIITPRIDPGLIPPHATELLWLVEEASAEEASSILALRPGWVLRSHAGLEEIQTALRNLERRDLNGEHWLRHLLQQASLEELTRLLLERAIHVTGASGGAVWLRRDDLFFQLAGDGAFPEAPLRRSEVTRLIHGASAWLLGASEQMGILRLREPRTPLKDSLEWISDVEPLLLNAWRLEESRRLSFQDDLTVAQNRRCLEAELPRLVREAAARHEPLAMVFLDVDNLKRINSEHGHPAGSVVIQEVAVRAKRLCRAHDRLYRYGGDEFCYLMPSTGSDGAVKLGRRMLRDMAEPVAELDDLSLRFTVSAGIAAFPEHADGAGQLLARADEALRRAKESGKDRIVIAE
jgi:diguanylate cyclase (GGDEF)-like protein